MNILRREEIQSLEETVVDMASSEVCEEEEQEESNKINGTEEYKHIGDQKLEENRCVKSKTSFF